jgi:protein-tyrosine phosphatase
MSHREIVPHVFLGDAKTAADANHVLPDVALVVNCTNHLPFSSEWPSDVQHIRIRAEDHTDHQDQIDILHGWTPELFDTIVDVVRQGRSVLVHCQTGRQRSAATIAALLVYAHGYSVKDAVTFIGSRKRDAFFPFVNFQPALDAFVAGLPNR